MPRKTNPPCASNLTGRAQEGPRPDVHDRGELHLPPLHPRPDLHLKYLGLTFHRLGCDRPHRAAGYWEDIWAMQDAARYVDALREARQGVRR